MTHRRRHDRVLSIFLSAISLACTAGCTEGQPIGDAFLEGVSNAISRLAEAAVLTFIL